MVSLLLLAALVTGVAGKRVVEAQASESEGLPRTQPPVKVTQLGRSGIGRVAVPGSHALLRPEQRLRGGAVDVEAPAGKKVVCDGDSCHLVSENAVEDDVIQESPVATLQDQTMAEDTNVAVNPEELEAGKKGQTIEAEAATFGERAQTIEAEAATFGERAQECWDHTKSWVCWLRGAVFPGNPPRNRGPPPVQDFRDTKPARKSGKPGAVKTVRSAKHFEQLIRSAPARQLVVVDFFATWCGPCKEIAPKYEQMAGDMKHALFLKVDVDAHKDLAQKYEVKSMPTFKLIRNGRVVDDLTGADAEALRAKVESLAGKASRHTYKGASRHL